MSFTLQDNAKGSVWSSNNDRSNSITLEILDKDLAIVLMEEIKAYGKDALEAGALEDAIDYFQISVWMKKEMEMKGWLEDE